MFRILHLSDLHARKANQWSTDALLMQAREVLLREANARNIDFLAFTGDITFSGKPEEYEIASEWIETFCLDPSGLNLDSKRLLFVPGNHDVDRSRITPPAKAIQQSLAQSQTQEDVAVYFNDENSLKLLLERHSAYDEFCKRICGGSHLALPSWTRAFPAGDSVIAFDGYCSSWLSRDDQDHRRLLVGQPQLTRVLKARPKHDFLIGLVHHPISDLMEFDGLNFESHLVNDYNLLLRGHLHRQEAVYRRSANGAYIELASGALHTEHDAPNHFSLIDISDDLVRIEIKVFIWKENKWVVDRNVFPDSNDGIGRFTTDNKRNIPIDKPQNAGTSNAATVDSHLSPLKYKPSHSDVSLNDSSTSSEDTLAGFPRFHVAAKPQDLAIRQQLQEKALLGMETKRHVDIWTEWGVDAKGFLATLVKRWRDKYPDVVVLQLQCGGIQKGEQLQELMAFTASQSIPEFAAAIRKYGPCLLILDDIDVKARTDPRLIETLGVLRDFCSTLIVIGVLSSGAGFNSSTIHPIILNTLDAADSREYMRVYNGVGVELESIVDYDRVWRFTGGLPNHIDTVIQALAYTDLNGALSVLDGIGSLSSNSLPGIVINEVASLSKANDDLANRAYTLLTVLCILERGESLPVIKRIEPQSPLWPRHAQHLEELGLLDVLNASPSRYEHFKSRLFAEQEKILRVPRVVRDHVLSLMDPEDRMLLASKSATVYFGSDWRSGILRMRRRPVFTGSQSTHRFGNEMLLLRLLIGNRVSIPAFTAHQAATLALAYSSYLRSKGFYGEGYEAAREFLGMIEADTDLAACDDEVTELQLLAGQCARMIGEYDSAVNWLVGALPAARRSKVNSRISDILLSLALAHDSLGQRYEATEQANEVMRLAEKDSSSYLQAKAILGGFIEDRRERSTQLIQIHRRARNLGHHTVADNIAIELANLSESTEETLQHLANVRSSREREYNYIRASVRRVELLLETGHVSHITELDREDLVRSYSMAFSQRLSGVFSRCHAVLWNYCEATGDQNMQRDLFLNSSFLWRLGGDKYHELKYAKLLAEQQSSKREIVVEAIAGTIRYCYARLYALSGTSPESATSSGSE